MLPTISPQEIRKRPCGCALLAPRDAQTRQAIGMLGMVLSIPQPAALLALCPTCAPKLSKAFDDGQKQLIPRARSIEAEAQAAGESGTPAGTDSPAAS